MLIAGAGPKMRSFEQDPSQALEDLKALWESLKHRADRLAAERQRYLEFFQNAPEACVISDRNGKILEVNRAAAELLDARPQYIVGKPLAVFTAAAAQRPVIASFRPLTAAAGDKADACWVLRPRG
jgi:PAS domain-containing protein